MLQTAEVSIVTVLFPGEHGVQTVMEVVRPLGIEAVSPLVERPDQSDVVEIALPDQQAGPPSLAPHLIRLFPEILKEMLGTGVDDRMEGI